MEGFLTLAEAAQQLDTTTDELAQEITAGKVVAIVRDGESWLSPGEVSRLARARVEKSEPSEPPQASVDPEPAPANPLELESKSEQPTKPSPPPTPADTSDSEATTLFGNDDAWAEEKKRLLAVNEDIQQVNKRLKLGLQETEKALRQSRTTRGNLENDIIRLTDLLKRAESRSQALEREVQQLSTELEKREEQYSTDLRRLRSKSRSPVDRSEESDSTPVASSELQNMREQMAEKDRIINNEYQERAVLRAQLDDRNKKYYELKAIYEKEKSEWSELLARELQAHGQLRSQLEELRPKNQKGWNPFRRDR